MSDDDILRGAASWQFKPKHTDLRLGDEITSYLKQHHRAFEKNAAIIDVWPQIVPELLQRHCRLDKRVGNTLYVQVMPGAYMHQIRMMTDEILEKMKQLAPRCGVRKIRIMPMKQSIEEL